MATHTTNYEFVKPEGNENADIIIFDNNMASLDSEMNKIAAALAIIQRGDTATKNIANGKYVLWKNGMYKTVSDIAAGDELGDQNLRSVSSDAMNEPRFPETRTVTWTYTVEKDSYVSTNLKTIIDADLPAGKSFLGVCGFNSGSTAVSFYRIMYEDANNSVAVRSVSGSKLSGKTATIHYLCI